MSETAEERTRKAAERYIEQCGEYTAPFEREKIVADWADKERKSEGLLEDFRKRAGEFAGKRVLEVGFGNGLQAAVFARAGGVVSGLEVNPFLLEVGRENLHDRGVEADLRLYDGIHFPHPDNYFDFACAVSVLEHTAHPRELLREVCRVLKPGGKLYLAFPNRWAPRETHTGIWLVGWLPRFAAAFVLKRLGSNAVEELNLHFRSFSSLRRMLRSIPLHLQLELQAASLPKRFFKKFIAFFGIHHSALLKTVMVVLEKKQ